LVAGLAVKAQLKSISSTETPRDLKNYYPDLPENFGLSVKIVVGVGDGDAGDIFDLLICTPEWLKGEIAVDGYAWGRGLLLVSEYNFQLIEKVISGYVSRIYGEDWAEIAQKLSRVAQWEFEDYQS
jgi:Immunity protein 8